ncbi:hypothetical protein J5690_10770 [bacterium]|nr:hypothetical protein [bacterium]
MRKFAKMLILFVTLFVTATLFPAEQPTFETICRQLASYRNTTGEFTQIKTTSLKKSLKSSGSFILTRDGVVWKTLKPVPSKVAIIDAYMITTDAKGKKTVKSMLNSDTFMKVNSIVSSLFAGDITEINKNFKVSFKATTNEKWEAVLVPKDKNISYAINSMSMKGTFVKGSVSIFMAEIYFADGGSMSYIFEHQKHPEKLTQEELDEFKKD